LRFIFQTAFCKGCGGDGHYTAVGGGLRRRRLCFHAGKSAVFATLILKPRRRVAK